MNSGGTPLLSVRAEARQLVAPGYAELDGQIEHTAGSKAEAVRSVTGSLEQLTADLAALGAVPFDAGADRRPLTWSAYSWGTREELYHDAETRQMERTGQVTATVALRVTVRDLDRLDDLAGLAAAHPALNVQRVSWEVDWDNPAWPQVRAAATEIGAAIGKARDYAAALGATVAHVEHRHRQRRPARRHRAVPDGAQRRVRAGGREPARDPGADSLPPGAHRDHRGPLPHHRRVPARRIKALPADQLQRMVAAQAAWPCFSRYRWWYSSAR